MLQLSRWYRLACVIAAVLGLAPGLAYAATREVVTIEDGWAYRWGDSPVDASGVPVWTTSRDDGDWTPIAGGRVDIGAGSDSNYLWFRVRLPDTRYENALLYMPTVLLAHETYIDTVRVYSWGEFAPGRNKYTIITNHLIPLPREYAGRTLYLRTYSDVGGAWGVQWWGDPVTIGTPRGVLRSITRRSIEQVSLSLAIFFIGIVSLFLFLRRHRRNALALGMLCLCSGGFWHTFAPIFDVAVGSEALRYWMRQGGYLLFPIFLYRYVDGILGPNRAIKAFWIVQLAWASALIALDVSGVVSTARLYMPTNAIFAITIVVMIVIGAREAIHGNPEARVFMLGLGISGLAGISDILTGLGVLPYWHYISAWGFVIFIGHLVYLAERRYAENHRLLKIYSRDLEDKSLQLHEYALSLEEKVRERTRDLDAKNTKLASTVAELRDTQQQLIMREKMASLGELVAGVAHEVNTPVGAIGSSADSAGRCILILDDFVRPRLAGGGTEGERVRKALDVLVENNRVITTASHRVAEIVKGLRRFSRLDEAEHQQADLHEGLDSTLALLQHQLKNRIEVVKDYGDIPEIDCYPNQINQVFMNVLVNAAQVIEGQGRITIVTRRDGDCVTVSISDTGRGIAPEHMDRLFDPGFTTKGLGVGTGLGLSISYRIVQAHRGTIAVASEPGKGATFTIRLPIRA
jgi:signal transduction histidine kinase